MSDKKYITINIPILDEVDEMEVVRTFNEKQLWYVCALAKAFEKQEEVLDKIKKILESDLSNMEKLVAISVYLKKDEILEEIE